MALARPAFADQQHRFTSLDVTAFGQLSNPGHRNQRCLREVELFQRLQTWQLRIANPVRNRVTVALFAFYRQQSFQVTDVALVFLDGLFGQRNKVGSHCGHADRFTVLLHAGVFQCLGLVLH